MKIKTLKGFYDNNSPNNLRISNTNFNNNAFSYKHKNLYSLSKYNTLYNNMNCKNKNIIEFNSQYEFRNFKKKQNYKNKINKSIYNKQKKNNDYSNSNSPNKKQYENNINFFNSNNDFLNVKYNFEINKKISSPSLPSIEKDFNIKNNNSKKKYNIFNQYTIFNKYYNSNYNYQMKECMKRNINSKNYKNFSFFSTSYSPTKNFNFTNRNNNSNIFNENNTYSLSYLLKKKFSLYKESRYSQKSFNLIKAYGVNTYKGTVKNSNEDRISLVANAKTNNYQKKMKDNSERICFFAIYDGHSGNNCSEFLKKNLHRYIFDSEYFPDEPVRAIEEGFNICEKKFIESIKLKNEGKTKVKDRPYLFSDYSGSCALIIIIIDDICYIVNLGDSRALYSYDSGNKFYFLTRDQKPNDPIEKNRIYKAGGSIFKSNKPNYDTGTKESEKIKIIFRILPGRLSVSLYLYIFILF